MTAVAWIAALALSALLVRKMGTRLMEARRELERRSRRVPVLTERYVGEIPKPLTAKQLAVLKDRKARLDARESYRERPYMN